MDEINPVQLRFFNTGQFQGYSVDANVLIRPRLAPEELHPDDAEQVPTGDWFCQVVVPVPDRDMITEAALDVFHSQNGIENRDDFDISVNIPAPGCHNNHQLRVKALMAWAQKLGMDDEPLLDTLMEHPTRVHWLVSTCERDCPEPSEFERRIDAALSGEWTQAIKPAYRREPEAPSP